MTPAETKLHELSGRHARIVGNRGQRLGAPIPDLTDVSLGLPPYRPGHVYGWHLPNELTLFLWSVLPGAASDHGFEMRGPVTGIIGRPAGYDAALTQAVVESRLLDDLPVLWESAWGAAILLRWAGPTRPDSQRMFVFGGVSAEFEELFRRARSFAEGHAGERA